MSQKDDERKQRPSPAPQRDQDDSRRRTEKRPGDPEREKDDELDESLDESFPASDPPSPSQPHKS
jgi:hypothetical protein